MRNLPRLKIHISGDTTDEALAAFSDRRRRWAQAILYSLSVNNGQMMLGSPGLARTDKSACELGRDQQTQIQHVLRIFATDRCGPLLAFPHVSKGREGGVGVCMSNSVSDFQANSPFFARTSHRTLGQSVGESLAAVAGTELVHTST